jgi:hypothetical protein
MRLHQESISGKRERNTLAIYLALVNNQPKGWLIHDIVPKSKSKG